MASTAIWYKSIQYWVLTQWRNLLPRFWSPSNHSNAQTFQNPNFPQWMLDMIRFIAHLVAPCSSLNTIIIELLLVISFRCLCHYGGDVFDCQQLLCRNFPYYDDAFSCSSFLALGRHFLYRNVEYPFCSVFSSLSSLPLDCGFVPLLILCFLCFFLCGLWSEDSLPW